MVLEVNNLVFWNSGRKSHLEVGIILKMTYGYRFQLLDLWTAKTTSW